MCRSNKKQLGAGNVFRSKNKQLGEQEMSADQRKNSWRGAGNVCRSNNKQLVGQEMSINQRTEIELNF